MRRGDLNDPFKEVLGYDEDALPAPAVPNCAVDERALSINSFKVLAPLGGADIISGEVAAIDTALKSSAV